MKRYLLDTNACIAIMKNNIKVLNRIRKVGIETVYLCTPVKAELWFGAYKSQRIEENQARLRMFFNDLPSLTFDDLAAEHFGNIRAFLARQGTPIGPYDLQIAAIATSHNLILVTHNTREFARIPNLQLEDWEE